MAPNAQINSNPSVALFAIDKIHDTGAVSLLEQLDKEIIVCLRDGRNFIGRLGKWVARFVRDLRLFQDLFTRHAALYSFFACSREHRYSDQQKWID